VTGLAVHFNWIDLSAKYPELLVLGEPAVLIAAGVMTFFEFFSDKIPWVDSAWDSIHTLIRPIGGGLLALSTMGNVDPAFAVIVAMLASGTSLMTHGLKAGTRLAINQSPEPVSNAMMSFAEDTAVLGGLAIMSINPLVFAAICVVGITMALIMAPKLYRRVRAFTWLFWQKAGATFRTARRVEEMTLPLSFEHEAALARFIDGKAEIKWSLPVVAGAKRKFAQITANTFGRIFLLHNDPGCLHFVGRRNFSDYHCRIPLEGLIFIHEPRFASEDVVIEDQASRRRLVFRLTIGSEQIARRVVEELGSARDGSASAKWETATTSGA